MRRPRGPLMIVPTESAPIVTRCARREQAALSAACRTSWRGTGTARHDVSDPGVTSRGWPQGSSWRVVHIMACRVTGAGVWPVGVGGVRRPCVRRSARDHDHDRHSDLIADPARTLTCESRCRPSRFQHGTVLAAVNAAPRVRVLRLPVRRALTAAARSADRGHLRDGRHPMLGWIN